MLLFAHFMLSASIQSVSWVYLVNLRECWQVECQQPFYLIYLSTQLYYALFRFPGACADWGYSCELHNLQVIQHTPFCLGSWSESFNVHLSSGHMVIAGAFGRLNGRWRKLLKRNDMHQSNVKLLVATYCILHNFWDPNGAVLWRLAPRRWNWARISSAFAGAICRSPERAVQAAAQVHDAGRHLRSGYIELNDILICTLLAKHYHLRSSHLRP